MKTKLNIQNKFAIPYSPRIVLPVLAVLLLLLNIMVYHDCSLYPNTIVRVSSVKTVQSGYATGDLGISEPQYLQTLTCAVQNGTYKNRSMLLTNTYTYTHMENTEYHEGDFLFLKNTKIAPDGSISGSITDQKRDYYLSGLLSLLFFGAIAAAGKRGFSFMAALLINAFTVAIGFFFHFQGVNFILITFFFILLFSFLSLVLCLGWNRQMRIVLLATLVCISILAVAYCLVMFLTPRLDYTLQDYIRNGNIQLEMFFTCGTLIGSLGAIMDVAVSITSGVEEILQQDPDISSEELSRSVRQIGHDVMGTMINVLFYTYMVGRIPVCIAQLANGMAITIFFTYYLNYEILRFLAGAVGIALCIPVSEKIAHDFYRRKDLLP